MRHGSENEILFVSSFPPRECGIATYTQDLMNAITIKFGRSFSVKICALENKEQKMNYTDDVKYILNALDKSDYTEVAKKINKDKNIKVVFIQHEFGLFSGEFGENILYFLDNLNKPVITSFHTVLPAPDKKRMNIVNAIIDASDSVVVMTRNSKKILEEEYNIPTEKISIIYHGIHLVGCPEKNQIKTKYDLHGKYVLSTFGLLSSGKSIETALYALPSIIEKFPNAIYLVLGKTHPEVIKNEGEKYREFLEKIVNELGIQKHVKFINKYLSLEDLLENLLLSDIYLFTSKDPNQAVSGTFSYAMGCSCPIISTPIPHAKEMLSDNAGIIVDFQNSKQLSEAVIELLSHPIKRKEMSLNALHKIQPTSWQNSAIAHAELFLKITKTEQPLKFSIPEISLTHIKRMTTKAGIIQFCEICYPDLNSGYTLDDNARALIALTNYEMTRKQADTTLIDIYLNFIKFAQQPDGTFLNYVDKHGNYQSKNKYVNLEDSTGRAIWALGEFISNGQFLHDYFLNRAEGIIKKTIPQISKLDSPRAIAFAIKGLYHYNLVKKNNEIKNLIEELANKLISKYNKENEAEWKWFEEYLTYANSILPEALLYAYLSTGNKNYKDIAKISFDFLLSIIFTDKNIKVISNRGWHTKGKTPDHFGEQPIDVAYTIVSLDLFYEVFNNIEYRKKMDIAFSWFHGNNHLHQIIYNPITGGCHDGLEENNVNLNQGAESTICYLLARLTMGKYIEEDREFREEVVYAPIVSAYNKVKTKH